jgi:hypothetical protein
MIVSIALALALQASAIDRARGNNPIPLSVEDEMRRDRDDKTRNAKQGQPVFAVVPTSADILANYPDAALKRGTKGSASIKCRVADDLTLTKCAVSDETPAKWGFGAAALNVSKLFKVAPKDDLGGNPKGVSINLSLQFSPTS